MSLKVTHLNLQSYPPGANELICKHPYLECEAKRYADPK